MLVTAQRTPFALPPATPAPGVYHNLQEGSQYVRNNFRPQSRTFKRVPSAQENEFALRRVLKQYWDYDDFRGPQLAICVSAMEGHDILVVAPTGIGKSICFQVPAMAIEFGLTIVVSPLITLMSDQVQALRDKHIPAAMLCENSSLKEKALVKRELRGGHPNLRLLYVTPETLFSPRYAQDFQTVYDQKQLVRLVVDEAHVIEEWGMTFRAAYRQLSEFRQNFKGIPITALTASATEDVRQDIVNTLGIEKKDLAQWVEPFNRKNLFYEVRYRGTTVEQASKEDDIAQFIKDYRPEASARNEQNGLKDPRVTGLVYCRSRERCVDVAMRLRERHINAQPFHAQLKPEVRQRLLDDWKSGDIECIVATIAFGMGIDQAHVRYVIHYDMPKSFEGYYQETGRAGRDGHISKCILYYSREDALSLRGLIEKDAADAAWKRRKATGSEIANDKAEMDNAKIRCVNSFKLLQAFAETVKCRHIEICRYFGEIIDDKDPQMRKNYCDGMCDVCNKREAVVRRLALVSEDVAVASQVVRPLRKAHSDPEPSTSSVVASGQLIAGLHRSDGDIPSSDGPDAVPTDELHEVVPSLMAPRRPHSSWKESTPQRSRPAARLVLQALDKNLVSPTTILRSGTGRRGTSASHEASPVAGPSRLPLTVEQFDEASPALNMSKRKIVDQHLETPAEGIRKMRKADADLASGGVVHKNNMDPEKRERQREQLMAVTPVSGRGGGPFSYYGNGINTSPQARALRIVSARSQGFKSPLLAQRQGRVIDRIEMENQAKAAAEATRQKEMEVLRNARICMVLEVLKKVFKDGEKGEKVLKHWGHKEVGRAKDVLLNTIAAIVIAELENQHQTSRSLTKAIKEMTETLRVFLIDEGVELVTSGGLRDYEAAQNEGQRDVSAAKLLLLERIVMSLP